MRKTFVALAIFVSIVLPANSAAASGGRVACGARPLASVGQVHTCWGGLIRTCKAWNASWMERIVYRESRGYPKAWNKKPVRSNGHIYHAYGIYQDITNTSSDPAVQTRNACAKYKKQGPRAWAVR